MTHLDIQAFLSVIQHGTVSEAANALYMSASTLSWKISKLESELGVELLYRKKGVKRVELTEAGKLFLPYAERLLQDWQAALGSVSRAIPPLNLAIAYGHSLLMEGVYKRYYERRPEAHLYLHLRHAEDAYGLVAERKMTAGTTARAIDSDRVTTIHVCDEDEVLLVGARSPLAALATVGRSSLDIADGVRWWLPAASAEKWAEGIFPEQAFSRIIYEDNNLLRSVISGSTLWTMLPRSTADRFIAAGCDAVIKDVSFETPVRHLYFIINKDRKMTIHMYEFLHIMREEFISSGMRWFYDIPEPHECLR